MLTIFILKGKSLDSNSKKSFIIVSAIFIFLIFHYRSNICECKKRISYAGENLNEGIDLKVLYSPMDTLEFNEVLSSWKIFNSQSDRFHIISNSIYAPNREVQIIEHFSKEQKHYGAVILPTQYDSLKNYPMLVWANGLDQSNPSVQLNNTTIRTLVSKFSNYIIVIPSYRGQALVYERKRYCSDGFFGDAFDGATDDALRLLALVIDEIEGADENRISVCGVSRGGTVALLMGIRNQAIRNVVSIAGPTDFFSNEFYYRYGKQYKYQFLSTNTSVKDIRAKMLKSSPIHFIDDYQNPLLLIHGKHDRTVHISHASKVIHKLEGQENFTAILHNEGHQFRNWDQVVDWIKNSNEKE